MKGYLEMCSNLSPPVQELVRVFNFHHYDNLRHTTQKRDPRRQKYETKGLKIVGLLFSAASGDVTAMRRWVTATETCSLASRSAGMSAHSIIVQIQQSDSTEVQNSKTLLVYLAGWPYNLGQPLVKF